MTAAQNDVRSSLWPALLAVQAEVPALQKDKLNPAFRSKYVGLETVVETVLPILNKHGLVLAQFPTMTLDASPALTTRIIHAESGEYIADTMPLILDKQNPQGLGSALTYAKRQAIMAFLGLVADEDDDGNKASRTPSPQRPAAVATTQAAAGTPATATQAQQTAIKKLVAEIAPQQEGISMDVVLRNYGGDLKKVTGPQADEILGKLATLKGNLEKAA